MGQPYITAVIGCTVAFTGLSASLGATIRHDVPVDAYIDYGDKIHLVGGVNNALQSFGSGVVIHPEWVLTAAHVVLPVSPFGISFETDPDPDEVLPPPPWDFPVSGFFFIEAVAIHEFYDDAIGPAGGFDIALLKLDRPIPQYTPFERFRANPASNAELGRVGTAVGFGATGTGLTGFDVQTGGFYRIASDNMIDAIASHPAVIDEFVSRTVVDPVTGQIIEFTQEQIASQFMMADFDAPPGTGDFPNPLGSSIPLDLEGLVAPGDSGGPVLFDIDGVYHVAGLNSWIYGPPPPWGDGTDDASYGDLAGYLRVSMFNDWIDGVIGIPEPSAAMGLVVFTVTLLRRRRG
jgi:hypothetical protein